MSKVRALGTTFKIGPTTATTAIGGLTSIGGLELSADTIDTTSLDSTGGYREFIGGFKDGGEVSLEGGLDKATAANQNTLYTAFTTGAVQKCAIEFPDGSKWSFDGIVTGFGTNADLEDLVGFSATIKVSGQPTFTMGTVSGS